MYQHPQTPADIEPDEWWTSPALAYGKGLRDGAEMGRRQAYAEMTGVFVEMFRANGQDFDEAWRRHLAARDAAERRRAWDASASRARPGDRRGRAA